MRNIYIFYLFNNNKDMKFNEIWNYDYVNQEKRIYLMPDTCKIF